VYQTRLLGKIHCFPKEGIQSRTNKLAKTVEFQNVFNAEVAHRGLCPHDVTSCLEVVYHQLSKYAHGNDRIMTLRTEDHLDNERAALAIILKVQENWPDGLSWKETKKGDECSE